MGCKQTFIQHNCTLGHGAEVHWRRVRREHQAHALPLPRPQDAPDPAGEGHRHRVHQERRLQVSTCVPYTVFNKYGYLPTLL